MAGTKSRYNSGANVNQQEIQGDGIEDEQGVHEKTVDSLLLDKEDGGCRECQAPSPGSVSIITLSSDSDNGGCLEEDEEDFERRFANEDEEFFKEAGLNEEEDVGDEELREQGYTPTAFNSGDSIVEATGGIKKESSSRSSSEQPINLSFNNNGGEEVKKGKAGRQAASSKSSEFNK